MKLARSLRKTLARRIIHLSAGAAVAVSALYLGAPNAGAATPVHIRESHGVFAIGAPTINLFDPVVETNTGRLIDVMHVSGASYELAFNADTSKCVAASNSGLLGVIHPCNGGAGVVWIAARGPDGHSCTFESQEFPGRFFAGHDDGTQFHVDPMPTTGDFFQFRSDVGHQFGTHCDDFPA